MTTTLKRVIGLLLGTGSYAVLTVLLAGCGGGNAEEAAPPTPPVTITVTTTVTTTAACAVGVEPQGSDELAYAAYARRHLRVYDRPGGRPGEHFAKTNPNGV